MKSDWLTVMGLKLLFTADSLIGYTNKERCFSSLLICYSSEYSLLAGKQGQALAT